MQQRELQMGVHAVNAASEMAGIPTTMVPAPAPFAAWLRATCATLWEDAPAEVPCGSCNACCRTYHQLHLRPDEKRARKRFPRAYLSTAPGLPPGYLLVACDASGACPVLVSGRCSIYEHRPLVCRTYDCRIYAATGIAPDREAIAVQVRRWRFGYACPEDRTRREAVLAAVRFVREHPECLPSDAARAQPIRVATLAVAVHERFWEGAADSRPRRLPLDRARVIAVATANEELFGDG